MERKKPEIRVRKIPHINDGREDYRLFEGEESKKVVKGWFKYKRKCSPYVFAQYEKSDTTLSERIGFCAGLDYPLKRVSEEVADLTVGKRKNPVDDEMTVNSNSLIHYWRVLKVFEESQRIPITSNEAGGGLLGPPEYSYKSIAQEISELVTSGSLGHIDYRNYSLIKKLGVDEGKLSEIFRSYPLDSSGEEIRYGGLEGETRLILGE